MSDLAALQSFVNQVLSETPRRTKSGPAPFRAAAQAEAPPAGDGLELLRFSAFIPEHTRAAVELAQRLGDLASRGEAVTEDGAPTDALSDALRVAHSEPDVPRDPELLRHAVKLFATHNPVGRRLELPRLEERAPLRALPATVDGAGVTPPHAFPPEDQLDWFRGDLDANEHHDHWHVVYPNTGLPVGDGVFQNKDRQGELFLYMHEQMLARYDAERLALGLPPVRAFEDYRQTVPEGFDPGDLEVGGEKYSPRPAGTALSDLVSPFAYRLVDHERRRERVADAVDSGYVQRAAGTLPLTSDLLGDTLEVNVGSPDGARTRSGFYGNFHGMGHVLMAYSTDPAGTEGLPPGVMADTAAAIRDPFFWRWHRHVDDFYFRWTERLPAHDFADAPRVVVRDGSRAGDVVSDIILATGEQVKAGGGTPQEYGDREFGGERWDHEFASGERSTDTLVTRMRTRSYPVAPGREVQAEYLYPDDFWYFFRVRNDTDFPSRVTLRVFLAPEGTVENRRTWIELDKFDHTVPARGRAVIARSSRDSSVVRKPVVEPGQPAPRVEDPSDDSYCKCGWPYGLLLPRGTREGMGFRLFVMATDWNRDRVRQDSCCGSFSYCGAQDFYPDRRPMGYPFDRPYPAEPRPAAGHPFYTMVARHLNMSTRRVRITWTDRKG